MAVRSDILKDIRLQRSRISRDIDLIHKNKHKIEELKNFITDNPFESAFMAVLTLFSSYLLLSRLIRFTLKLVRIIFYIYAIKQSMSYIFRK